MNGEEMLKVFIFHPYCMELQGYDNRMLRFLVNPALSLIICMYFVIFVIIVISLSFLMYCFINFTNIMSPILMIYDNDLIQLRKKIIKMT